MSVTVNCQCGKRYALKDEFEGRDVKCPQCGTVNRAARAATTPQADPAFDRDIFLLRQKTLAINEKYSVLGEKGDVVLFVERPRYALKNMGALFGGIIGGFIIFMLFGALGDAVGKGSAAADVLIGIGALLFFVVFFGAAIMLPPKRNVTFYRDDRKSERLLEVLQDRKFQPITATFTIRDRNGNVLATLSKNHFVSIFRKRWELRAADGRLIMVAKEDSAILALLRRVIGPLLGVLRTNFIFCRGDSDDVIGEFKRNYTILDRYVLDLTQEPARDLDRRLALAVGVMLDTGERR